MTLDELLLQRDNLLKNINSGTIEVRFGERWIKLQKTEDMQRALTGLDSRIAALRAGPSSQSMCNFGQFNG